MSVIQDRQGGFLVRHGRNPEMSAPRHHSDVHKWREPEAGLPPVGSSYLGDSHHWLAASTVDFALTRELGVGFSHSDISKGDLHRPIRLTA